MKRVFALILALALVMGLGFSSFAFDGSNIKGFADGKTLADGVTLPKNATWNGSDTVDLGVRYAMDKFTMSIDLYADMFGGDKVEESETLYYALDTVAFMNSTVLFTQKQSGAAPQSWDEVKAVLAAADTATQLQPGIVATTYEYPTTTDNADYDAVFTAYETAKLVKKVKADNLANTVYFTDKDGVVKFEEQPVYVSKNLSPDQIRRSKITLGTIMRANSNAVKSIALDTRDGQVDFKLVEEWVSTGDKDFEVTIYLSFNGKRATDQEITIIGNIANPEIEVDKNHDYVDISDGYVAVALDFNREVEVYVGNGATVHTKFFKDKKYYCITSRDADQAADVVFKQYKDVDNVLTFKNVGLNNSGDYVTLATDYADYWVYDKDLNYLGRGTEKLAFSHKYYLANSKLDIVGEVEEVDVEEDKEQDVEPPKTGGDGSSDNVNVNPGTGR